MLHRLVVYPPSGPKACKMEMTNMPTLLINQSSLSRRPTVDAATVRTTKSVTVRILYIAHLFLSGFPRLLESPGFLFVKFPGTGKSWKMNLNFGPRKSCKFQWKVLESLGIFWLWCGRRTRWCRWRCKNLRELAQIFYLYILKKSLAPGTLGRLTDVSLYS